MYAFFGFIVKCVKQATRTHCKNVHFLKSVENFITVYVFLIDVLHTK